MISFKQKFKTESQNTVLSKLFCLSFESYNFVLFCLLANSRYVILQSGKLM